MRWFLKYESAWWDGEQPRPHRDEMIASDASVATRTRHVVFGAYF
jgi:hypothetical protein